MNYVGPKKPKKEGWKERTKELKTMIVKDPTFDGILFMIGQAPLRKIGLEKTKIAIPGAPTHTIMNASHPQAPPYRIIITNKGYKLYTKGLPPVLIQ